MTAPSERHSSKFSFGLRSLCLAAATSIRHAPHSGGSEGTQTEPERQPRRCFALNCDAVVSFVNPSYLPRYLVMPTSDGNDEKRKWIQTRSHPAETITRMSTLAEHMNRFFSARLARATSDSPLSNRFKRVFGHYGVGLTFTG